MLLALSANTSFGGLPVLLKLLARDNYVPHVFGLKADRQGSTVTGSSGSRSSRPRSSSSPAATPTPSSRSSRSVFVGFTIAQTGMVLHWRRERGPRWVGKAVLNGLGALLTGVSAAVVTATRFHDGAWLIVIALALVVLAFETVHRAYGTIGERLGVGRIPEPPHRARSLVLVPVSSLTRLTSEALTAAVSLGDEARAVTVCHPEPEDRERTEALERDRALWNPGVDVVRLPSERGSLGPPPHRVRPRARAHRAGHPRHRPHPRGGAPAPVATAPAEPTRRGRRPRRPPRHRRGDLPAPLPLLKRRAPDPYRARPVPGPTRTGPDPYLSPIRACARPVQDASRARRASSGTR